MMRSRKAGMCVVAATLAVMALLPAAVAQELIEATTASGEKVRLHPNGRCIMPSDKDYSRGTLNSARRRF